MIAWPWRGDSELRKSRRVAIEYRKHLHVANLTLCQVLDGSMRDYGQFWLLPREVTLEPEDVITADIAAERVGRSASAIRRWASTPHPYEPGRMLLPGFGWDGPRRTFLVADVDKAVQIVEERQERTRFKAA